MILNIIETLETICRYSDWESKEKSGSKGKVVNVVMVKVSL